MRMDRPSLLDVLRASAPRHECGPESSSPEDDTSSKSTPDLVAEQIIVRQPRPTSLLDTSGSSNRDGSRRSPSRSSFARSRLMSMFVLRLSAGERREDYDYCARR